MKRSKTVGEDETLLTEEGITTIQEVVGATTWRNILRRFRRNEAALVGMGILGFFIALALIAILDETLYNFFGIPIFPYGPNVVFVEGASAFEPPSEKYWFGTDNVGRDIFVRIIYGAGISIRVGFLAVFVSLSIGTVMGLLAGYFGGIIDSILSVLKQQGCVIKKEGTIIQISGFDYVKSPYQEFVLVEELI